MERETLYTKYSVIAVGLVLLIIYIIYDFIKNKRQFLIRRIILYSFLYYCLVVIEQTTGGIIIPPKQDFVHGMASYQFIPFHFVGEWMSGYYADGMNWRLFNSMKLTFFNIILLFPMGVYLALFGMKNFKIAFIIIFLTTLTIESYQILFSYFGLTNRRIFDVDDIILNSLGGMIGFFISLYTVKVLKIREKTQKYKFSHKS